MIKKKGIVKNINKIAINPCFLHCVELLVYSGEHYALLIEKKYKHGTC